MVNNLDNSNISFPQDERITFEEEGHIYLLDGKKRLTPVSSVYSQYFKPFETDKWAEIKAKSLNITPEELKEQWNYNSQRASFAGTHMHKQIEEFLNGDDYMAPNCLFKFNGEFIHKEDIINIEKEISLFRKFTNEVNFTPFRTEWRVFNESLGIAGTIDLICSKEDGTYEFYDWKRSKSLIDSWGYECRDNRFHSTGINGLEHIPDCSYWHYALQQNLYKSIVEKCYGLKISAMHLVVIHQGYNDYHIINVPNMPHEIQFIEENLMKSQNCE